MELTGIIAVTRRAMLPSRSLWHAVVSRAYPGRNNSVIAMISNAGAITPITFKRNPAAPARLTEDPAIYAVEARKEGPSRALRNEIGIFGTSHSQPRS